MKIDHCFLSTDVYFPFILFLTFVPHELHHMLADARVGSCMSKNWLVRQFFSFFFFKVVILVCALARSLCLNLHKEAFGAGVSLWVSVWLCVEVSDAASAHSMICVPTLHVENPETWGLTYSCWSVEAAIPGWKGLAELWKKGHNLQVSCVFSFWPERCYR